MFQKSLERRHSGTAWADGSAVGKTNLPSQPHASNSSKRPTPETRMAQGGKDSRLGSKAEGERGPKITNRRRLTRYGKGGESGESCQRATARGICGQFTKEGGFQRGEKATRPE